MRRLLIAALLVAGAGFAAVPGLPVGAKVPDFQLTDQSGQVHDLKSVMGPKGLMLVFFRSADW